jgi:uncharacterized repeat protein (TIGR01451 family)
MRRRLVLILSILGLTLAVTAAPVAAGTSPIITLTKTDTPDPVLPGGILTYTVVITNCSLCAPGIVTVNDPIPTGTSLQSTTATDGTVDVLAGSVQWTLALGTDASETLTIAVLVDPGTPPGTIIQNTAIANQVTATAQTTVGAPPTPTPAASLADAAMADPATSNPLATLGLALLLIGSLGTLAFAHVRRR